MTQAAFHSESVPVPGVPGALTIRLSGEVTLDNAAQFRTHLLERMADRDVQRLILQLSQVDRMDTSGAAVLAEALKQGHARGMRVLLCSPSPSVMRIFRLAGFEDVLGQCCADPAETKRRLVE